VRILLVSANRERLPSPVVPPGLLYVAGAVRDAHDVTLLDLCFEDDPEQANAGLCEPCSTRADCKTGALCMLLDGADSVGACGAPCAADADCPATHACVRAHDGSQCVPRSGTCERTLVTSDASVGPSQSADASLDARDEAATQDAATATPVE